MFRARRPTSRRVTLATMDYDLLVIDLDGTLLDKRGRVSDANRRAVLDARAAGLEVIIATGRALSESLHALEAIEHEGLVVAAGGALLCEAATRRTIQRNVLPPTIVQRVADALVDEGHKVLILKDRHAAGYDYLLLGPGELDAASQWWFDHLPVSLRHAEHIDHDEHPGDTIRAGAVATGERLRAITETLRDSIGQEAHFHHWSAVTATQATGAPTHLLEVFSANVNKWTMIQQYAATRDLDASRIAAIGDEVNDLELLTNVGLSIAMGNAVPEVAAVAHHHTADHHHDGVAHAISRIVSGTW